MDTVQARADRPDRVDCGEVLQRKSATNEAGMPSGNRDSAYCTELRSIYNKGQESVRRELLNCYATSWRRLFASLSNTVFLRSPVGLNWAPVERVQGFLDSYPLLVPWDEDNAQWSGATPHLSWIFQYNFEQRADVLKLISFLSEEEKRFGNAYEPDAPEAQPSPDVVQALVAMGRATQRMQYRLKTWLVSEIDPQTGEHIVLHGNICPAASLNCWTFAAYFVRLLQYAGIPAERLHYSSHSWLALRYGSTNLMADHEARQYTGLPLMGIMTQNVVQAATLDSADEWRHGFGFFQDYAATYFVDDGYFFDGQHCLRIHGEDGGRRLLPATTPLTRPTLSCSASGPGEIVAWDPSQWNLLETNNMTSLSERGDLDVEKMLPHMVANMPSPQCSGSTRRREIMRAWLEDYFGAVDEFERYVGRPTSEPSRVSQALEVFGTM